MGGEGACADDDERVFFSAKQRKTPADAGRLMLMEIFVATKSTALTQR